MNLTFGEAKQKGITLLKEFSPSSGLDVSCFLCSILNCDKTFLLLHHKDLLTQKQEETFFDYIEKRQKGLPVAYITGKKEFFGLDFFVTPDVLIPKPDTEILVENAIEEISKIKNAKVCDMCTGSGCIGISVAKSVPHYLDLTLVDISPAALEIAKTNANSIIPHYKPAFIQSNLFEEIPEHEKYHFILTNPPYIPASLVDSLLTDGRSEPRLALDGDNNIASDTPEKNDGLGIIRNLFPQMKNHLSPGGIFLMETGEYNAEAAAKLAEENGFINIEILKDLEGQLRVVKGTLNY
ncbi:MAG: peptide chain release factor N(5)-glutamine methyltransferase [Treponema sp.]|nr:peptide chain release factor N(5)-glutamine methyltransferase [Treponema sp.]